VLAPLLFPSVRKAILKVEHGALKPIGATTST